MAQPTVILGMSGGVDSSVAASLLVEGGYAVTGVTLKVWEDEDETVATSKRWQERGCCKVGLARHVAKRLGISHEVIDTQADFRSAVIDDFVARYLSGTTPNPCVRCNERVKLRSLFALAEQRQADFVATGHYARVIQEDGAHYLHRSTNQQKDQSYFLYRLHRSWLPRLLFPVGRMQKAEVWARAEELGLPMEELKESQEICFVTQGDYRSFLHTEAPQSERPGMFVDEKGTPLGSHRGIAHYTPGQRRGLGVAVGRRLYVKEVIPKTNTVVLGRAEKLFKSHCRVGDLNVLDSSFQHSVGEGRQVSVKVRYATPSTPAIVSLLSDGKERSVHLKFSNPQWALSPGQSAVFYDHDRVLGGGIIHHDSSTLPA